jgi:hypothetical protein
MSRFFIHTCSLVQQQKKKEMKVKSNIILLIMNINVHKKAGTVKGNVSHHILILCTTSFILKKRKNFFFNKVGN